MYRRQIWQREYRAPHPLASYDYGLYWLFGLELRMMNKTKAEKL